MTDPDRTHFNEASLGEAQADNPPDDPEMIYDDAEELDTDTDFVGDGTPPPQIVDNDDPAPNVP